MTHENQHHHEHERKKTKRGLHRDWRTWLIVGLMLAAMFAYVMSDDESLRYGAPAQQPVPAAP